jgi:hypothetical protein
VDRPTLARWIARLNLDAELAKAENYRDDA